MASEVKERYTVEPISEEVWYVRDNINSTVGFMSAHEGVVRKFAEIQNKLEFAERQHSEIKQRTATALAEFEKLTKLIETECKALGIEWHGSAETTLKAVIEKLREGRADDQSTWEIVEYDGKRYRKEPVARLPKKGEKYFDDRVDIADHDFTQLKEFILHEITDEAPQVERQKVEREQPIPKDAAEGEHSKHWMGLKSVLRGYIALRMVDDTPQQAWQTVLDYMDSIDGTRPKTEYKTIVTNVTEDGDVSPNCWTERVPVDPIPSPVSEHARIRELEQENERLKAELKSAKFAATVMEECSNQYHDTLTQIAGFANVPVDGDDLAGRVVAQLRGFIERKNRASEENASLSSQLQQAKEEIERLKADQVQMVADAFRREAETLRKCNPNPNLDGAIEQTLERIADHLASSLSDPAAASEGSKAELYPKGHCHNCGRPSGQGALHCSLCNPPDTAPAPAAESGKVDDIAIDRYLEKAGIDMEPAFERLHKMIDAAKRCPTFCELRQIHDRTGALVYSVIISPDREQAAAGRDWILNRAETEASLSALQQQAEADKAEIERLKDRQIPEPWELFGPRPTDKERIIEAAKVLAQQVIGGHVGDTCTVPKEALQSLLDAVKRIHCMAAQLEQAGKEGA